MTDRHVVVDHVLFVVTDLVASRRLVHRSVGPIGIEELDVEEDGIVYGRHQLDDFAIYRGEPPTTAAHVAFDAAECGAVDSFFEAAIAAGGRERGEPAVWASYSDRYYAAFVDDLHGNNVEAVFHSPEPVTDAPVRSDIP